MRPQDAPTFEKLAADLTEHCAKLVAKGEDPTEAMVAARQAFRDTLIKCGVSKKKARKLEQEYLFTEDALSMRHLKVVV